MAYLAHKDKRTLDLFNNTVNVEYQIIDRIIIDNASNTINLINMAYFRELINENDKVVCGGEGPKQETLVCFYTIVDNKPICGFIAENKMIGLLNNDGTTFFVYDNKISKLKKYIDPLPKIFKDIKLYILSLLQLYVNK